MANPQKEDGNTGINNDVLDKLISSGINGTEWAVCMHVLRKTWGFNKKTDFISLSQFLDVIPATKPSICKALSNLQLVKILLLVKKGNSKNSYNQWKFNKNYDSWQLVKKSKLVKKKKSTSKENFTHNINTTKKIKEVSNDTPKKTESINFELFLGYWNHNLGESGFPKVLKLTEARKSKIRARVNNDSEYLEHFKLAIPRIYNSDFLSGKKSDWKATFDWLIENDKNYLKVLEGNYDNNKPAYIESIYEHRARIDAAKTHIYKQR